MKTVSLCANVHGSLAIVTIKSTTSLFYQIRNVQNYAVECTCQTKLKVCVSVFDLVTWRRGQTTIAVSSYTRTLVRTTHCASERATVSGKIGLMLCHEKTSKCTCTWHYVGFSGKFHFPFGLTGYSASWARPASLKASSIAGEMNSNGFVTTVLKSGGLSFTIRILWEYWVYKLPKVITHQVQTPLHTVSCFSLFHNIDQTYMGKYKYGHWIKKKSAIWQVDKI